MNLSQSQKSLVWIAILALVLAAAALTLTLILRSDPGALGSIEPQPSVALREDVAGGDPAADLPIEQFLPNEVLNLDAQDAMARNLALPVSNGPNPVAPAFVAQWLGPDLGEATKCLATAVYYEAAGEPMAGQRAVAQVVLNRLRSPRYPKTICGVIYQGAERPTGCQFSFACDGSTRRVPSAAGMAVATAVATAVINGVTSAEAGQATHYHTLAVFPAWAPQLAKIGIIGHHVFYRPPGRATFGYDAISKAPPEDPLLAVVPAAVPLPEAVPTGPAVTSVIVADTSPSMVRMGVAAAQSSLVSEGAVKSGQSGNTTAAQAVRAADATAVPRRSMFPVRRNGRSNLPLASDH